MKPFCSVAIALCMLFTSPTLNAQEYVWAKETGAAVFSKVKNFKDGFYSSGIFYGDTQLGDSLFKTNSWGNAFLARHNATGAIEKIWRNGGFGRVTAIDMDIDEKGNIYLLGSFNQTINFGPHTIVADSSIHFKTANFVLKIDSAGNYAWCKLLPAEGKPFQSSRLYATHIAAGNDSTIVISGWAAQYQLDTIYINAAGYSAFIAKLSAVAGTAIWSKPIVAYQGTKMLNVDITGVAYSENNKIFAGGTYDSTAQANLIFGQDTLAGDRRSNFLVQYDAPGNRIWATQVGDNLCYGVNNIYSDSSNILVSGERITIPPAPTNQKEHYLAYLNHNGQMVWTSTTTVNISDITAGRQGLYFTGHFKDTFAYNLAASNKAGNYIITGKADRNTGSLLWHTEPVAYAPHSPTDGLNKISANGKGGLWYTGNALNHLRLGYSLIGTGSIPKVYGYTSYGFAALIRDTTYTPPSNNIIQGNVFNDTNFNCINNSETGLKQFGIMAMPGAYCTTTDAAGNYTIKVDTGNYALQLLVPSGHHFKDSLLCMTSHTVPVTGTNQVKTGYDYPNKYEECALLWIQATQEYKDTIRYRSLLNKILIHNLSFDTALNVGLIIKYPGKVVSPVYSNIPWQSYNTADSLLTFSQMTIPPDSYITIHLVDTVSSYTGFDTLLLYKMSLTPINNCYPEDTAHNHFTLRSIILLGVDNVTKLQENITIYPNPTSGKIFIKGLENATSIDVYNVAGQKVYQQKNNIRQEQELDLSGTVPGVYVLIIKTDEQVISRKIIKQ